MALVSSLCDGCQSLANTVLDPNPVYLTETGEHRSKNISVHKSFADLAQCAEGQCALCLLAHREFYYHSSDGANYRFPEELLAASIETVSVNVGGIRENGVTKTEYAQFFLGKLPGPSFDLNNGSEGRWAPSPSRSEDRLSIQSSIRKQPDYQRDLTLLMRHWLTKCLLEHKRCARQTGNQEDMFLPTRLINVGTASEPGLNLVLSADLPRSRRSQYITLSYCWGSGEHSALTTALNLGERYLHIDIECLPKTFQDAIEISRQLKILYIWIDALCIVQPTVDDFGDWEEEIPLMGKVYRNSTCTIAASGARSSDGGCLTRRDAAKLPMFTFTLRDDMADPTRKGLIKFKP